MTWIGKAETTLRALGPRVLMARELDGILEALRVDGIVPPRMSADGLLEELRDHDILRRTEIRPADATGYRPFTRYILGEPSASEVALSLRPRSYLSHGTALRLHGLVEGREDIIYVNQEQSPKPVPAGKLEQAALDRAFANRPRESQYVFRYNDTNLLLIAGKNTGNFGVAAVQDPVSGRPSLTTDLARTLIDVAVRPVYAGGVSVVAAAYQRAVESGSAPRLVSALTVVLDTLAHVYPYHQAVGHYLAKAGVPAEILAPLRDRGLEHDFYLAHQLKEPAYDSDWRVYFPANAT